MSTRSIDETASSSGMRPGRRPVLLVALIGLLVASFVVQLQLTAQYNPSSHLSLATFLWLPVLGLLAGALLTFGPQPPVGVAAAWPGTPAGSRVPGIAYLAVGVAVLCAIYAAYLAHNGGQTTLATGTWVVAMLLTLLAAAGRAPRQAWRMLRGQSGSIVARPSWPVVVLAGILAIAAVLRLPDLGSIPGFFHNDEANVGLSSRAIAEGQAPAVFGVGFMGLPDLGYAWDALFLRVLGDSLVSLRLSSAVLGLATILVTGLLGKELFNWRAGLIAAAALAFWHLHIHFSRDGLHNIQACFTVTTTLYLLVLALRYGARPAAVGVGILLSLDLQVFFTARLAVAIAPLCLCAVLLLTDRQLLRSRLPVVGWMLLGLLTAALPIAVYIWDNWYYYTYHITTVFSTDQDTLDHMLAGYGTHDVGYVMRTNIWQAFQTFNYPGHVADQYPLFNHQMLDPVSGALLPAALAYACFQARRTGFTLCLIPFAVIMIAIGMLTLDQPDWNRLLILLPFLALLIGAFLDGTAQLLEQIRGLSVLAMIALLGLLAAIGYGNYTWYFNEFQPAVSQSSVALPMGVGYYLRAQPGHPYAYAVAGESLLDDQAILFLAPQIYHCNLLQGLNTRACPQDTGTERLFFILPERAALIPALERAYPGGRLSMFHTYPGDGVKVWLYRMSP